MEWVLARWMQSRESRATQILFQLRCCTDQSETWNSRKQISSPFSCSPSVFPPPWQIQINPAGGCSTLTGSLNALWSTNISLYSHQQIHIRWKRVQEWVGGKVAPLPDSIVYSREQGLLHKEIMLSIKLLILGCVQMLNFSPNYPDSARYLSMEVVLLKQWACASVSWCIRAFWEKFLPFHYRPSHSPLIFYS